MGEDNLDNSKIHIKGGHLKWTPSQGQYFLWVKVYFSLFFIVLIMLPSWQLLFPNKSLQAFFLPEIDVVTSNCKTEKKPF